MDFILGQRLIKKLGSTSLFSNCTDLFCLWKAFIYKHISLSSALTLNASHCPVALILILLTARNYFTMNDIKCPHCHKVFKVDEAGFADILKQVRDHRFEEELESRLSLAEKDKQNAIQLAEANLKNKLQEDLASVRRDSAAWW